MRAKGLIGAIMAVVLAAGTVFPAFAADKKIDTVKLTFSYGSAPATGETIGDISASKGSSGFSVDSVEYTNADDKDTWTVGDVPEVKVELSANDGYKFSYTSKSHFSLSGCNAEFSKAKIYDSGSYMELYVKLKRVGGKLEATDSLEWNDTTAEWAEIEGAKSYDVKLLRGSKTVTTISTTGTSYDFVGYINKEGDYTFRVRAIASYNSKAGEWSDDSDTFSVDESEVGTYTGAGRWLQDSTGWWYAYNAGGYPAKCWKQIDGVWYHFDNSGYMQTGWLKLDGQWFYLNGSGAMVSNGWQYINGKWYYFDTDGVMYSDSWTPDGYYVNASGAWVQ